LNFFEKILGRRETMPKVKGKKSIIKKWWFWVFAIIIFAVVANGTDDEEEAVSKEPAKETSAPVQKEGEAIQDDTEKAESEKQETEEKPIFDVKSIAGKSEEEVLAILGEPDFSEDTEFKLSETDTKVPAKTIVFGGGSIEVFLIEGTAQRITYTPEESISAKSKKVLESVGLSKSSPDNTNDFQDEWLDKDDLYKVQVNKDGNNVSFYYFIVDEKYE
jgi:hypothetical protein